jgi:hypothetical protein
MSKAAVEAMLRGARSFAVAAAACGKTELAMVHRILADRCRETILPTFGVKARISRQ